MRAIIKKSEFDHYHPAELACLAAGTIPERPGKKLWLTPGAFLRAINGPALAQWALQVASWLRPTDC